jgi:RimJ/RimL family protein N-acetyltransferase
MAVAGPAHETGSMNPLDELWPVFGLRVRCGQVELRAVQDADLPAMVALVQAGVHDPARMPFAFPWTDLRGEEQVRDILQHHWRSRSELTPEKWSLELGVWRDGVLQGVQAVSTQNFPITRTGETGSWVGLAYQGRGTGTLMRQAICALCFDHLGFTQITSGAFTDNPESMAVSRKVGYRPNGETRHKRRDEMAVNRNLVLTTDTFLRAPYGVDVEGVDALRRLLGIDGI